MSDWEAYKQTMVSPPTLWSAAKENDLLTLQRLCGEGHHLDARDHRGYSALMLAAYSGNLEAFGYLLERGADPNSVDLAGNTVLMGATFKGHEEIVRRLLAAGADLAARNNAGLDAHAFAVMFGRTGLVELVQSPAAKGQGETPHA